MQFTRNWGTWDGPGIKGCPGSAEALTGDNRKKNIFIISDVMENVKPTGGTIYGAGVFWLDAAGEIHTGIVTGECCQNLTLGITRYRIESRTGYSGWVPGRDIYRGEDEAKAEQKRRAKWTTK